MNHRNTTGVKNVATLLVMVGIVVVSTFVGAALLSYGTGSGILASNSQTDRR